MSVKIVNLGTIILIGEMSDSSLEAAVKREGLVTMDYALQINPELQGNQFKLGFAPLAWGAQNKDFLSVRFSGDKLILDPYEPENGLKEAYESSIKKIRAHNSGLIVP